ncbi:MAG: RNA polymerase factor sigma-54 [Verrucomicrobia bacterium]|nr:RNA polymerase factor sigma-54 [Verrucomicrobiota bacterium]
MAQGLYLSQKMSLSQVLAPQLQQSLQLLQAPTLELKALVEQELQQNPVLEEVQAAEAETEERGERAEAAAQADPAEPPVDVMFDPATEKESVPVDELQAQFEKLTQLDQDWRDNFAQTNSPQRATEEDEERRQFMFDSLTGTTSLQEELLDQLRQSDVPEDERPIAEMLIGNIDDYGYLQASVEEMARTTGTTPEDVLAVLAQVQQVHPAGVGARNLRECLLLQLARAGKDKTIEYRIIDLHMEALGKRRFPEIAKALGVSVDDVQESAKRIAHLEPRPGREFLPDNQQYILPEVFVTKDGDDYSITTNNDHIPHLRISNTYKDLMAQAESSAEVREYIREKVRSGKFLIKSLHQRQSTILNIAKEIVKRQREFFDQGIAHLKPLTMGMVAGVVGVHETTVSRAVSNKYMETPRGIFEMKYFFTSGVTMSDGTGMSSTSIKDLVAGMLKGEDPAKPLSDQEIVKMLSDKGINIARRTVAKYRSELGILPSNLRKVY